jgi:hypothetical protein
MINGQMAEAQKGYTVLDDVDKDTFERYMQWAYQGYYKAADFEPEANCPPSPPVPSSKEEHETTNRSEVPPPAEEAPAEEYEVDELLAEAPVPEMATVEEQFFFNWARPQHDKKKKKKGAKTSEELKEPFLHREYTVRREAISVPATRANRGNQEDYTEVFLSHAHLYVFAEKYDI